MKNKKMLKKFLPIFFLVVILILGIVVLLYRKNSILDMTPQLSRAQEYETAEGDEWIEDTSGSRIDGITFNAFFLTDVNGDGEEERIRGTCSEIGNEANLYMEIGVEGRGKINNATIKINSNNFYFNTSIVKDNVVAENYISSNTKEIKLNEMTNGSQKQLMGNIRSGDYSSSNTGTEAIGNDTTKYSMENKIVFSGEYEDSYGRTKQFEKDIPIIVDWYGEVDSSITPKTQTVELDDLDSLVANNEVTLEFDVSVTENRNQLIMSESYISGTIPKFNGYEPISVKISGTNVTYTYDVESETFSARREAVLDQDGKVTLNAYTSSASGIRKSVFKFSLVYPVDAYLALGEDVSNFELAIPVEATIKGYNNPNTDNGFQNPYTSETASGVVTTNWKIKREGQEEEKSAHFKMYIGNYISYPYYDYTILKDKPMNIYTGKSLEETDDRYLVHWEAYTGINGATAGITMQEGDVDKFATNSQNYTSMEELTTNIGISFTGATNTLGEDGWIKVYDADNNNLIETFTSEEWNKYTSSSEPYVYPNPVKHIRVETSNTNEECYFHVYSIKELDDTYITENYTLDDFNNFAYIYSYLDGSMESKEGGIFYQDSNVFARAYYEPATSIANISINEDTISTQNTTKNEIITIEADTSAQNTSGYRERGWVNGVFLVKLPKNINLAEINNVTIDHGSVLISAYDIYEDNGNYYIKILTENVSEETYKIMIDCNLTPDPRVEKQTETIELWAINEVAQGYYYSNSDTYDLDGDLNTTEQVNYRTISLTLDPGESLTTTQIAKDYDQENNTTIAPRVAEIDKSQQTATISITSKNNYRNDITDIKIQGAIPFKGNVDVINGNDMGSQFTTQMKNTGIQAKTEEVNDYMTVYYSTNENPTSDINLVSNDWTLARNVRDWEQIKTYLIVIDKNYKLLPGNTLEFEYQISLPEEKEYNEVAYSTHAVYFYIDSGSSNYHKSTESEKLGFMVARQYDLKIVKHQQDKEKKVRGVIFTIEESGEEKNTIKVTGIDGVAEFKGLYAKRNYILKEVKAADDYVLSTEEIHFYTYTETNSDGSEELKIAYVNEDGSYSNLSDKYELITEEEILPPAQGSNQDYVFQLKIANQVKAKLKINKTDGSTNKPIKNIKFRITGKDQKGEILTTDTQGNANLSGINLNEEYILEEIRATGYYLPQNTIKFTIINDNGEFKLNYTDNETVKTQKITIEDEIPTINFDLQNEKIPTYGLQLTKYAKGEQQTGESGEIKDKTLLGAQYKISGDNITDSTTIYTTDSNGIIKIDGLYEYVDGKDITGEYTLTEIYAPEGYSLNPTSLKFRAYREDGILKVEILEGEDVLRVVTNDETQEEVLDLNIRDNMSTYPIVEMGVEDGQIFSLFKYEQDGSTTEKIPIAGTKFVITDLEGKTVTGSDGNAIGEWDETLQNYVVTTDQNGQITASLPEGLYKAIEVYTPDKYVLAENEEDRTYYFGIDENKAASYKWINITNTEGSGWEYINSIETPKSGGIIGVGSFSEYSGTVNSNEVDGIDLNKDGQIDKVSEGINDGLIVAYDSNGNYTWSRTFGGNNDDALNKIIQTRDGEYIVVGYVKSSTVKFDGVEIPELSRSGRETNLANKDAVLMKIDANGNYKWGVRFGGLADDEITTVIQTSRNDLVIAGKYYSDKFNFYNVGNTSTVAGSFTNPGKMSGFVATYSESGQYKWSQSVGGSYDDSVTDIAETDAGIVISANGMGTVYFNTSHSSSVTVASTTYTSGLLIGYTLDGIYSWNYLLQPEESSDKNIEISSIITNSNDHIIAAVAYTFGFSGTRNGGTPTTIISSKPKDSVYDATLLDFSNDGTYNGSMYTLTGDSEDYISKIKLASDGGILIGGWTYSDKGVDVDEDNSTNGSLDFSGVEGLHTSDGFLIKLNTSYEVERSNKYYGDGYDGVTGVGETSNGNLVAGGFFSSTTLKALSNRIKQQSEVDAIITTDGKENFDGFIAVEGVSAAEVPTLQNVEVENKVKTFKVTTEVKKHLEDSVEVAGGDIDGQVDVTIDGITYSKDGIRYVETVKYGEDSVNEIKITPDSGYTVASIIINGVAYKDFSSDENGIVTLPIFENVLEDKHIAVEFSKNKTTIEVNHYLWIEGIGITTEKIVNSETYIEDVGESYTTSPKTDIEYELITNEDYYGEGSVPDGLVPTDYYIPNNSTGVVYRPGEKEVVDYYYKEKTYTLTVHHYLAGTENPVPLKGTDDGSTVPDEFTEGYKKGTSYETNQASEDLIDYNIYELVSTPENAKGTIEEDTVVTYYYDIKEANITITKVAEEDHNVTLGGTEFTLYKAKTAENDDLIDTDQPGDNWEVVGNYTTPDTGLLRLQDLPITSEYRLVETKASDGRMLADGQWKIEFVYGEYDENDETIKDVNGMKVRITAIGNPPALAIAEDGSLELPNREIYQIPTSGGLGIDTIYQVGLAIALLGATIFVGRKFLLAKGMNLSSKGKRHARRSRRKGKH